jgi:uncharacterized protein
MIQKIRTSLIATLVLGCIFSTTGLVLAQTGAPAADPARLAAARDLMKATNADELYGKMFSATANDEMTSSILEQIQDPAMRERVRKETADLQKSMQQELMKQREGLLDITAAAYARAFTVEDMKAVAAFYRSPLGAKLNKFTLDDAGATAERVKAAMQNKPLPKPVAADPAKLKAAKAMMEASGMNGVAAGLANPPAGSSFAAMFNEANEARAARLANALTLEEIAGITEFYKTPAASKFVKATPQIAQDVAKATMDKLGPALKMPSPPPLPR